MDDKIKEIIELIKLADDVCWLHDMEETNYDRLMQLVQEIENESK